jgi:hypothetical protein
LLEREEKRKVGKRGFEDRTVGLRRQGGMRENRMAVGSR